VLLVVEQWRREKDHPSLLRFGIDPVVGYIRAVFPSELYVIGYPVLIRSGQKRKRKEKEKKMKEKEMGGKRNIIHHSL